MTESHLPSPDDSLQQWLDAIGAPTVAPAGGAAAAVTGAFAAALVVMVASMTMQREKYADVRGEMEAIRVRADALHRRLLPLAARDAEAFSGFARALGLPSGTEPERSARIRAKRAALRAGAAVQLELLVALAESAELGAAVAERGLAGAIGDAATAVFLAAGAARSAHWAIRSNLPERDADVESRTMLVEGLKLLERVERVERRVRELLSDRLG